MSVDINGPSAFPEVNSHRDRLKAQMARLEKEGKQDSRKYKRCEITLQKLQVMNFITPEGEANYSPAEFGKTASAEATVADAYLAGYCLEKKAEDSECLRGEPGIGQKENEEAGLPARGMGQGRKKQLLELLQKCQGSSNAVSE